MLTDKIVPAKECAQCRCLFTPNRYVVQRFCSRLCANHAARAADPAVWEARRARATAISRAKAAARRVAALTQQFGELSVRELTLAAAIRKQAYMDGYNAAYGSIRVKARTPKAAA